MTDHAPIDDNTTSKKITLDSLTFDEAVAAILNAPPTPEQQAKKAAAKARREERKRKKQRAEDSEHSEGER